jgi:hypothetical protein
VTVDVDISSLIGQPVSDVVFRLRQQGLIPRVLWQPSDQQSPGRVTAIWPAGHRPVGSLVTVVGALPVPATAGTSQQASKSAGNENGSGTGKGKGQGQRKRERERQGEGVTSAGCGLAWCEVVDEMLRKGLERRITLYGREKGLRFGSVRRLELRQGQRGFRVRQRG